MSMQDDKYKYRPGQKVTLHHKDGTTKEVEPVDAKEILAQEDTEYSAEPWDASWAGRNGPNTDNVTSVVGAGDRERGKDIREAEEAKGDLELAAQDKEAKAQEAEEQAEAQAKADAKAKADAQVKHQDGYLNRDVKHVKQNRENEMADENAVHVNDELEVNPLKKPVQQPVRPNQAPVRPAQQPAKQQPGVRKPLKK